MYWPAILGFLTFFVLLIAIIAIYGKKNRRLLIKLTLVLMGVAFSLFAVFQMDYESAKITAPKPTAQGEAIQVKAAKAEAVQQKANQVISQATAIQQMAAQVSVEAKDAPFENLEMFQTEAIQLEALAKKDQLEAAELETSSDSLSKMSADLDIATKRLNQLQAVLMSYQTRINEVSAKPSPAPLPMPSIPEPDRPKSTIRRRYKNGGLVRVYFATDRSRETNRNAEEPFNAEYSEKNYYGYCDVSIPPHHIPGELETPAWYRLEFRYDTAKHVVLKQTVLLDNSSFYSRLNADASDEAFVFVTGYNVGFSEAARRTAQIARDIDFSGLPIFYSWPSNGKLLKYIVDGSSAELGQADLAQFLEEYLQLTNKKVYLFAHSMGNRVLTGALMQLIQQKPELAKKIKDVVLAAPDINSIHFRRTIGPFLVKSKMSVTLYASSKDNALIASKKLNGYPRAGDAGPGLVVMPGIETIDATAVDMGLLGHSYVSDSRNVLSDIYYLLRGMRPDYRHGLKRIDDRRGPYWSFD